MCFIGHDVQWHQKIHYMMVANFQLITVKSLKFHVFPSESPVNICGFTGNTDAITSYSQGIHKYSHVIHWETHEFSFESTRNPYHVSIQKEPLQE